MEEFAGKVAVVLGASAERGTGWGIAKALAQRGVKVVVGARSFDKLAKLAEGIGAKPVRCDATREEDVAALARAALDWQGKLDIAVNAAGVAGIGSIAEANSAELLQSIQLNYFGSVYFVKHMAEAIGSSGSITIISSLAATHPMLPLFSYACGKAATDCLVRYAALEYGSRNIRINSLLPGPIMSEMTGELYAQPGFSDALSREIPLGRLGYPDDFANAVIWLAGSAYVTGANLPIAGGMQLARFPYPHELPGMGPAIDYAERVR